jgi:hypothetical protein
MRVDYKVAGYNLAGEPRQASKSPPVARPEPVLWYAAAIVLAGLLAYSNSFSGPFLFDDFGSIVRNASIRDLTNLRALFTTAGRDMIELAFAAGSQICRTR